MPKEPPAQAFEPLDEEEKELIESTERGEWRSVHNVNKKIREAQQIARNTSAKNKRITIRISARDLDQIQQHAQQEGIPYQTLIASIIHKYNEGLLLDKRIVKQVVQQLQSK